MFPPAATSNPEVSQTTPAAPEDVACEAPQTAAGAFQDNAAGSPSGDDGRCAPPARHGCSQGQGLRRPQRPRREMPGHAVGRKEEG